MSQNLNSILSPRDGPVVEIINPTGTAPVCLVCEHASAFIPEKLADLGLAPEHRLSHAVWDPGALAVARGMAAKLNAPLVASRVSRLVIDCNRPPIARDAMPRRTETIDVPGNQTLSEADRTLRTKEVYIPFHKALGGRLDEMPPESVLVTIHSFTPVWNGQARDVELGVLHDRDDRLANAMLAVATAGVNAQLNAPYSASDGVTHTLREHGTSRDLRNVMIEIRNDLIADDTGVTRFADMLSQMLTQALAMEVTS